MAGYTKLFSSILASTIWRERDSVRIVWITMLAMTDKDGRVEASVPGLADLARVSIEDCEHALERLSQPDHYSRSQEQQGRRIEKMDGGWRLVNHGKYRALLSREERKEYNRLKQQESRARRASVSNVSNVNDKSALSAHTEAEADTKGRRRSVSG